MTFVVTSPLAARRGFALVLLGQLAGCSIDPRTDLSPGDGGADGGWVENSVNGSSNGVGSSSTPDAKPIDECVPSQSNLVLNPKFEADVEGWVLPAGEEMLVSSHDGTGSTSSGALSLRLDMSHMSGNPESGRVIGGALQCVPVEPNTEYQVATGYRIESGNATTASITAFQYEKADCSGDFLAVWSSVEGGDDGGWEYLLGSFETKPGARALGLRLNVAAPASAGIGSVLYDDVYLSTEPFCADASEPDPSNDAPEQIADAGPEPSDDSPAASDDAGEESDDLEADETASAEPEPTQTDPDSNTTDESDEPQPTSSEPADAGDGAEPTEPEQPSAPSYAETVEPIFLESCVTACHEAGGLGGPGANAAIFGALDLSEGEGYASLVGVQSEQVDMSLVGQTSEGSYLWYKLLGTQADAGSSDTQLMPFGLEQLDDGQLQAVVAWIEGGAAP